MRAGYHRQRFAAQPGVQHITDKDIIFADRVGGTDPKLHVETHACPTYGGHAHHQLGRADAAGVRFAQPVGPRPWPRGRKPFLSPARDEIQIRRFRHSLGKAEKALGVQCHVVISKDEERGATGIQRRISALG